MIAALLLELALKSAVVAALTLVLVLHAKRLPAAHRAALAHIGLLILLMLPVAVTAGPDLPLAGFQTRAPDAAAGAAVLWLQDVGPAPALPLERTTMTAGRADVAELLALAWIAGTVPLLVGLGVGLGRLVRLQRQAAVLTDREWLGALAEAQHHMGVKQGTALLRSDGLASPVSWGWLRPTIVLSPAALGSPAQAKAILAHELAHVVRKDWLNLLIARLACAVLWFNPLVWLLAWQAHELREEAADDVVLRGHMDGPDYATLLVAFARGESRTTGLTAHGVAPGRKSLKRRLQRVLDLDAPREPTRPVWLASCLLAALAVAAPLAALTPSHGRAVASGGVDALRDAAAPGSALAGAAGREAAAPVDEPVDVHIGEAAVESATDDQPIPAIVVRGVAGSRVSVDDLAHMRAAGVTPEWIASLEPEVPQIRQLSPDALSNLAAARVSVDWIRAMKAVGYSHLTVQQIQTMAALRIGPTYVRELAAAGYSGLSVDQLISLKAHGVDAGFIGDMDSAGMTIDSDDPPPRSSPRSGRRGQPPNSPEPQGTRAATVMPIPSPTV